MEQFRIFAVNPGSTSTKIALFEGDTMLFSKTVDHEAAKLAEFKEINDQLDYRKEIILKAVEELGHSLAGVSVFVGRGGGFVTTQGGTYEANELMLEHARIGYAAQHPSNLGVQLADSFVKLYGGKAYVVNGPTTDEFQEVARVSGFADIPRQSVVHALNQKEIGIRYSKAIGKAYHEINLVIAHIGGGISVTAHRKGKMVDSNDVINGDGPMAPTRSGALPAASLLKLCFSGKLTQRQIYDRISKSGGFVDHLGTSDAREISRRIQEGDKHAKLIYDAMIYQIAKNIGAYATVLKGDVQAIILTGGIARDEYVVAGIRDMAGYIAPIEVMPGEFEMEALAAGALRVLRGEEQVLTYTGIPVWSGFEF